ncbi:hypothetical protein LOCC1_G005469 [Lachnellula occidentalis]|uniref:Uncharacterized protein n=1 Tax=Lachnellula occidentalis TaxID=215460 RepID=A0A8H8RWH2_9HELO|nr:hypothetical protein LOCC1_G005469 [Lachnellula occidentalis]
MPRDMEQEGQTSQRVRRGVASERQGQHESMAGQDQQNDALPPAIEQSAMTLQEKTWWGMGFEELYREAKKKNFGKHGKEGRKTGRVRIIRWLCEKEGITPFSASTSDPPVTASTSRYTTKTGAISHPEAVLCTSDSARQRLINEAERAYLRWPSADLLNLSMQRSYQLLKDSSGKLPPKSVKSMAAWNAGWDVLKSPREKNWWMGDGIDLANKAKAMGYQGPTKKYDIIVWLRTTPEEAENKVQKVAESTSNKRKAQEEPPESVSKRPAKGSRRPHGWDTGLVDIRRKRPTVTR